MESSLPLRCASSSPVAARHDVKRDAASVT
jgi:hypothetical protein